MSKEEIYNVIRNTFHSQSGLFLNKEQAHAVATIIWYFYQNQNKDEIGRLLKLEKDLSQMFDSDTRIALALLEEIRKINKDER